MKPKLAILSKSNHHELALIEDGGKGRLSVAKCRDILQEEGEQLSDEEIVKFRDFFYELAAISLEQYQFDQQQAKLIYLEQHKITEHEKGDYLRAG
jgi:alcohol dehydrogenase YqhD (iron-dependent ADH family)